MSLPALSSPDAIVHGRDLQSGFEESCDVVVVGSGAGGAVMATLLAEAGKRVIVIEEGPYFAPQDYQRFKPSDAVRNLFREAGMMTAFGLGQTPVISMMVGRAVGGSSLLTGGVCFRIPSDVHHRWVRELGLHDFSERALESAYEEVEKRVAVREIPVSMRSKGTARFVEGAQKLGIEMRSIRRNTGDECEGNARCNFTCPAGAKRSVDIAYLGSAVQHGTRIVSDALALRVLNKNGRAAGVEGKLLGGKFGAPSHRFRINAPVVVSACGTLHTPLLLFASGLGPSNKALGNQLTLHPAARIVARFDERMNGWDGALQSVYSDHFHADGIKLVGVYTATNVLAAGLPGVGKKLREHVQKLPYCGAFGAMIHDEGGGHVRRGFSREPLFWYRMAERDLLRLRRSMTILCEIALAAGAREVFAPVFGFPPITNMDEALAMERAQIDARRIECLAFHPLGSARAANDARRGVVDQNGECFSLPGLFVADGSILPTSIGVNSQIAIMSMATRLAHKLSERLPKLIRQAAL